MFWLAAFLAGPTVEGNGPMLAFETDSEAKVDAFYAAALALGGSDAGEPGVREGTHCVAYARDPEGNTLCVFTPKNLGRDGP